MNKKIALFMGRFAPPHKGHIQVILNLVKDFDKVIIGLGSCYEAGTSRHPLLAVFREKMLLYSLFGEGCDLSKVEIMHLQDYPTFGEWFNHVLEISKMKNVTHFVTGNNEDILSVIKEQNIATPFAFINPEDDSPIAYHASDLRKAINDGDYQKFKEIAAPGTIALMANVDGFNGIRKAIENIGSCFFNGRQTVDIVFTLTDRQIAKSGLAYEKKYLLCGTRSNDKIDFPSWLGLPGDAIKDYESPTNAALRALEEKTGLKVTLLDKKLEPAHILIETGTSNIIAELKFLKLFNTTDLRLAGLSGGSSQCFHININASPQVFTNIKNTKGLNDVQFRPIWEALEQGLAYQQKQMVELALNQLSLYDDIEG